MSLMPKRARLTGPRIYEIKLIVETDDEGEVERLTDAIQAAVCPVTDEAVAVDHACRVPWFVVRTELSAKNAEAWRGTLNR